jgi:hypothetical protein
MVTNLSPRLLSYSSTGSTVPSEAFQGTIAELGTVDIYVHSSGDTKHVLTLLRRNQIPPGIAACRNCLLGILILKGLTAQHLYKLFGVKGLIN